MKIVEKIDLEFFFNLFINFFLGSREKSNLKNKFFRIVTKHNQQVEKVT